MTGKFCGTRAGSSGQRVARSPGLFGESCAKLFGAAPLSAQKLVCKALMSPHLGQSAHDLHFPSSNFFCPKKIADRWDPALVLPAASPVHAGDWGGGRARKGRKEGNVKLRPVRSLEGPQQQLL